MNIGSHVLGALKRWKGDAIGDRLMRQVAGVEAEFTLLIDGRPARPEHVFGDPRGFITVPLMHRTGRSFHLPNGTAIYFDTGVIEIASPVMEFERGVFGRLARSMDASIKFVRAQLDGWERRTGRRARLQGFSTHYNISVPQGADTARPSIRIQDMAWLLAHVLPAPVMLLGTNKRSTGVGVRPRPRRIEVTADFPPDPTRLAATGSVIGAIVAAVSSWADLNIATLRQKGIPVVCDFRPRRHTSRRGWLARYDCFAQNPFACGPDERLWSTTIGIMSLRQLAHRVFAAFRDEILRVADPLSYRLTTEILTGVSRSWLDQSERPPEYDDVGRGGPLPDQLRALGLARYERVILNAIAARPIDFASEKWIPIGVRGWSRVVFRRDRDGALTVLPLDTLVEYLDRW